MKKMHFPSRTQMDQINEELIDSYDYLSNAPPQMTVQV